MKQAQRKDFFREIKKSLNRYLSILFIVALGVAFYAGIRSAEPDMQLSADTYFDQTSLMDIQVMGTLGMSEDDVEAIKAIEGVTAAEGGYSADFLTTSSEQVVYTVNLFSLCQDMNQMTVLEGRLPETTEECFVDRALMDAMGLSVGDQLVLESGTDDKLEDTLNSSTYTIVGSGTYSWYLNSDRGTTTIGDGNLDGFAAVLPEAFNQEYYSVVYARAGVLDGLNCYTDEYENRVEEITDQIEAIADSRCEIHFAEVKEDAEQEIADGEQEIADGYQELEDSRKEVQQELADALQELEDGEAELEDGRQELIDAEAELENGRQEIADGRQQLEDAKAELTERQQELEDAKAKLPESRQELEDAKAEIEQGRLDFAGAVAQWEDAQEELDAGWDAYNSGMAQLEEGEAQLNEQEAQLEQSQTQLAEQENQLNASETQLNASEAQLNEQEAALQQQIDQLTAAGIDPDTVPEIQDAKAQLEAGRSQLEAGRTQIAEGRAQIEAYRQQLDAGKQQIDAGRQEIEANKEVLADSLEQLESGQEELDAAWKTIEVSAWTLEHGEQEIADGEQALADAEQQIADGEQQIADGWAEIEANEQELNDAEAALPDAEQEIADGWADLADAEAELENGRQEYEDGKAEAEKELADAEQELADAEAELADAKADLADLEMPEWYVLDRNSIQAYVEYGMDSERIGAIGQVFPAIFFLVAALVSLTTMTRMVEEERTLIGTMKALGYGKWSIASKYLLYALSASLLGSLLGVAVGSQLLPWVIMTAYGMLYDNLRVMVTPVNVQLSLLATGIAVACTAVAALGSCYNELRSTPAQLMRPAAPPKGKRVLLEYLPFIWKRISFTTKATIRNLFRYKKRFLMTVFGIGACMALLMVGFGLRDSIQEIVDNQYQTLWIYDAGLTIDEDKTLEEQEADRVGLLETYPEIESSLLARTEAVDAGKDSVEKSAYIFVPQTTENMDQFVVLQDRITGEKYTLDSEGVIISEKLSTLLDVQVGDEIYLKDGETERYTVTVTAISENYLYHYIYMTSDLYESLYGETPAYNQLYLNIPGMTDEEQRAFTEELLADDMVESVEFAGDLQATVQDMMRSLDMVIWVLIISAGLLAYVVLYNLNNINITERRRELATLKVLGFYDGEVAAYVYRENIYLTILGVAFGVVLGIFLHRYVILTCEIDTMMFGRDIRPLSYVYSILITIMFTIFVNLTMFYRLRKIDMVESLKSVE